MTDEVSRHHADGRVARGERTREAILVAHTALLREGVLKPTGKLIAERAGISLRTLWLNVGDLETLLEASVAYWLAADAALAVGVDPSAPLGSRVESFCRMRVARLEHLAPAARSAALGEPFSPALQAARREHADRVLHDVDAAFGVEITAFGADGAAIRQAVFGAASWPSWSSLRDDLGLSVDETLVVMRASIAALLRR